ncbi:MAG TPA: hypothetical protein VMM76_00775 [Pirellulaceae bacterium]|nr:hypothetical protein [Pirellulaceae bacterium]
MYHTPGGIRVLKGAEKRLYANSLGMMVDLLSDDDFEFGIGVFDRLQRNQKIATLHSVTRALFFEDEPAPP